MTLGPEKRRKGPDMLGTPDEHADAAKFHAEDLQRAMQRDQAAKTRKLTRVRRILRRVLGREDPPASP